MKKLMFVCLMAMFAVTMNAQTPWKIIDMENVTKHGGNCWFDLPEVSGDITGHTQLNMTVLKSTCMLKVVLRYKDADGKQQQVDAAQLYYNMGKTIDSPKKMKIDLTNKGKIGEDALKNITSIRISMAKAVDGNEEPWMVQFGEVTIQ